MKTIIFDTELDKVQLHPLVKEVYKNKNLEGLKLTMNVIGQLEAVKVVERDEFLNIIDGAGRYYAAKELGFKTIRVEVLEYTDEQINDQLVLRNFRTKRSYKELCDHAELILGILGKSQGKKRETIGDLTLGNDDFALAGKDRFGIACEIIGCDISATSLRRIFAIRDFEENGDEEAKGFRLMERLESGEMLVNQAYDKMKAYKADKAEQGTNALTEAMDYIKGNHFELFNKTNENLSDIPDNSIDCATTSNPYFGQRNYPDGTNPEGMVPHGQEENVDEYVRNQVKVFSGVRPKLKETGSLFVIMADSYNDGKNCMAIYKFAIEMMKDGWFFVDEWIWRKTNQKPQTVKGRLLPTIERILHFVKDPNKYYFREFKNWQPNQGFEIVKGKKSQSRKESGWSFKRPLERFRNFLEEQDVRKIIETAVFNWQELSEIDPKFKHLAPFPSVIPLLPILMTTKPGETVLDIYSGSGTTTAVAVALGRNAIGYDTDTKSHNFAAKRLQLVDENRPDMEQVFEFENEFMLEPITHCTINN
ncbi:MAG: ParB N-terminal domain-containing protein [Bacteroidetes bacterium]|nr:ParB N-terminal domain-containing protein [Bacteroidota bacterium]